MAIGDLKSILIRSDGWSADVTIEGWGANVAGVAYNFGYTGTTFSEPGTLRFTVVSKGFDASGNATTVTRLLHATATVRKVFPNQAQIDETNNAGDLVVRVALSDFIYLKDKSGAGNSGTDVTASCSAGWANNGTNANASAGLVATNNSAKGYPKLVAKRPWFNHEKVQANTYLIEVVPVGHYIYSDRPFVCVKYTATDESAISVTGTLTSWGRSSRPGPLPVVVCQGVISLATLTKHQLITCHMQMYPWVGDTTEVVDTTSESDLSHTQCGPIRFFNDKDSDYPSSIAYVQWSISESYTGVAAALGDNATARAAPHPTIWKARQAIAARNLAQYGRNDLNGGIIYIMGGTTEWCWRSSGTLDDYPSLPSTTRNTDKCELLITRDPLATRETVIINKPSARGVAQNTIKTQRYRITDVTIGNTVDTSPFINGMLDGTDCCVLHNCLLNHTQTGADLTYRHAAMIMIGTPTGSTSVAGIRGGTASSSVERCILARGNLGTYSGVSSDFFLIGNNIIGTLDNGSNNSNTIVFMNRVERPGNGTLYTMNNTAAITGHRCIGNCFVNYSNTLTYSYGFSNDASTGAYQDAIIAHNSFLGGSAGNNYNNGRFNFAYNEFLAGNQIKDGLVLLGNYIRQWNIKTDVFANNATCVNNWSMIYAVGSGSNVFTAAAVDNTMFYGRNTLSYEPVGNLAFVNPTDSTAGGGNYTPTATSTLRNRVLKSYIVNDIEGKAMTGTVGAYQCVLDSGMGLRGIG